MLDKVWFTYKARIQAYHRLEWMDTHSQFLLVWYAILSAVLAVVVIRYPVLFGRNTDILGAVLSIALLVVSLSVANRDFRGRAMNMRKNYLALQHLYNEINSRGEVNEEDVIKYGELLNEVENHKQMDDKVFRVRNSSQLTSRNPKWIDYVQVYTFIIVKYVVLVFSYLSPFVVAWCLL
ncbi:SLATT domain-containing protein [Xenorhabdus sp. XENO-7]|uniref:SLATT domain-containing protein n=1 Tax=Xenorhabdus aichiensis TaxID=3025874 RepID=A0ABT5M6T2_9GAMM|nr:SLATT domain-containing protein [Xenorhabdus aichiensis]MDC9623388.1 SLATT domain-containing protein [Xenorhabdus aichiensis]